MSTTATTTYTDAFSPDAPITELPETYSGGEEESTSIAEVAKYDGYSGKLYDRGDIKRKPGAGSISEESAKTNERQYETEKYNHWNKRRRTIFYPDDTKYEDRDLLSQTKYYKRSDKWTHLNRVADGNTHSKWGAIDFQWSQIKRNANTQYWIAIFCSQLGLTEHQQDRVEHVFEKIDGTTYSDMHEEVIMALISLAQNEDVTPNGKDVRETDMWGQMIEDLETDKKTIRRLRKEYHPLL